jgi:hypothetical protein
MQTAKRAQENLTMTKLYSISDALTNTQHKHTSLSAVHTAEDLHILANTEWLVGQALKQHRPRGTLAARIMTLFNTAVLQQSSSECVGYWP